MAAETSGASAADLLEARGTADRFLQAVARGDEGTARALLIVREGEKVDFASMRESTGVYELGEASPDPAGVVVPAKVKTPGSPESMTVPLVLVRGGGAWRVDMTASMDRMFGGSLETLVTEMAKGLGDAMAKGFEAISEGLSALSGPAPASEPPPDAAPPRSGKRRRGKRPG